MRRTHNDCQNFIAILLVSKWQVAVADSLQGVVLKKSLKVGGQKRPGRRLEVLARL